MSSLIVSIQSAWLLKKGGGGGTCLYVLFNTRFVIYFMIFWCMFS